MDTKGPIEVASRGNEWGEDRKLDLVVRELARYDVVVGALQETKWFGCGTYKVGDSMVLTSGRNAPRERQLVQRGEGVALVLRRQALPPWRLGDSSGRPGVGGVCPQFCRWITGHLAGYS